MRSEEVAKRCRKRRKRVVKNGKEKTIRKKAREEIKVVKEVIQGEVVRKEEFFDNLLDLIQLEFDSFEPNIAKKPSQVGLDITKVGFELSRT